MKDVIRETKVDLTIRRLRPAARRSVGNERGMALILVLVMLALLGILGSMALDTSTTDLKISGNFRSNQYAFYAADGGVGYVTNPNILPAVYNYGEGWQAKDTLNNTIFIVDSATNSNFKAYVPSLLQGPMPQGGGPASIYDSDVGQSGWHGVYTAVTSTGTAVNNALVVVEAVVAQAVPN
jgi:hypothetical protein